MPANVMNFLRGWGPVVNAAVGVLAGLALIFFVWGLAKFILFAGNESKRAEGKQAMVWGIIGLFVIISIWGIINLLDRAFGLTNTSPLLPTITLP